MCFKIFQKRSKKTTPNLNFSIIHTSKLKKLSVFGHLLSENGQFLKPQKSQISYIQYYTCLARYLIEKIMIVNFS